MTVYNRIAPKFALGINVSLPPGQDAGERGEIIGIDIVAGTYTVFVASLGHMREGLETHGRIFTWEALEDANAVAGELAVDPARWSRYMSEKLREALDRFEAVVIEGEEFGEYDGSIDREHKYRIWKASYTKARSRVESLFQSLQETALRANTLAFYSGACVTTRRYLDQDAADRAVAELNIACAKELSRISATPDTREESEKERGK